MNTTTTSMNMDFVYNMMAHNLVNKNFMSLHSQFNNVFQKRRV